MVIIKVNLVLQDIEIPDIFIIWSMTLEKNIKHPFKYKWTLNYQVIWCSLNSPFLYCFIFPCSCTQLILGVRAPRQRWSSPSCGTFRVKGSTQLNSKQASEVWISVCIWCLDRCAVREKDVQACLFSTASDLITDMRTVTFFFFFLLRRLIDLFIAQLCIDTYTF